MPADYRIGIVPASDTGAVEMALWSLLGERPRRCAGLGSPSGSAGSPTWSSSSSSKDARTIKADYGKLPDLGDVDFSHDVVFTWNGTTSGVRVPNGDWIPADREGLTICDATSAAFAQPLAFDKLDVVTFSWQKALGGEAAHGMLILSPRAVERLESYTPPWPLPKIFRMTKGGKLNEGIFVGETINTPSMLCVEDYLDTLAWAKSVGGLKGLMARADANFKVLADWAARTPWIDFFAEDPATRSNTSVSLKIVDPDVTQARPRRAGSVPARHRLRGSTRKASPTTSPSIATRRRISASGRARPSRRPTSSRSPRGSTGASRWRKPRCAEAA